VVQKWHKVYGIIILQHHCNITTAILYITDSCGFQQNVQKEMLYVTKVIV